MTAARNGWCRRIRDDRFDCGWHFKKRVRDAVRGGQFHAEQSLLLRLVRRSDVVVDGTTPRLEGRGAYVHAGCLGLAVKRQAIRRAFGAAATLDPALMPTDEASR